MPLCLNPGCQKRVPENSLSCRFCGGKEIAEFDSYSKQEEINEKLTMENFERVVRNSHPFIERTIIPPGEKVNFKSRIAVRLLYLKRKLFPRKRGK
jgi:hypothetical protein